MQNYTAAVLLLFCLSSVGRSETNTPLSSGKTVEIRTAAGNVTGVLLDSDAPEWVRVLETGVAEPTLIKASAIASCSQILVNRAGVSENVTSEARLSSLETTMTQLLRLIGPMIPPPQAPQGAGLGSPVPPAGAPAVAAAAPHAATEVKDSSSTMANSTPSRTWTSIEIALTVMLVLFGAAVLFLIRNVIVKLPTLWTPQLVLRAFGLVLVIIGALVLVTAGYDVQQISPAMGLLGAIAGYLLGTNEQQSTEAVAEPTTKEQKQKQSMPKAKLESKPAEQTSESAGEASPAVAPAV